MRALVLLSVLLAACTSTSATEPASMRDRLAAETHLIVLSGDSTGAITAQLRTDGGWEDGAVKLQPATGELIAHAGPGDAIELTGGEFELQTIAIPATLTGQSASLTRPQFELTAPATAVATWTGDNSAELQVGLALKLSWTLTVDGDGVQVGAPQLPPLPAKLELSGDGARVSAYLRIQIGGDLWSWADLVKLSDLKLVVGAADTAMR
jgi:hypothetical protein